MITRMRGMIFVVVFAALGFAGCQYPMGLSKDQWNALTPEQQAEYRRQQFDIDERRRREREAEEQRRRAEAAEKARIEQERIRAAYAAARYGDVVTVTVEGGTVAFIGRPQPYEPLRFDLVRGERKQVEFVQQGRSSNRTMVEVRLSEDGNTFYFDEKASDRIALISTDWEKGRTHGPLTIRDAFSQSRASGISIALKYKPLPGGPRRVIIEERPKR
ncbi:MAG: hypothetical protein AB1705_18345 [Verrucomicrobiota bacterium]